MFFGSCVSHAFASVHCCLVVTCWERPDLLALVSDVYFFFVTFPCSILGQVWYLMYRFLIFAVFLTLIPGSLKLLPTQKVACCDSFK